MKIIMGDSNAEFEENKKGEGLVENHGYHMAEMYDQ